MENREIKTLKEVLEGVEIEDAFFPEDPEEVLIKGIEEDSRLIKEDFIFVARKGLSRDGESFIPSAISKGAVAIIKKTPPDRNLKVAQIQVKHLRKTIYKILVNFYGDPCKNLTLIGVTGTNGKTSVSYFTKEVLTYLGIKSGYIGTLFYDVGERIPSKETTPSLFILFSLFKKLVKKGYKACVLEVSSHALSQDRIYGLCFDIGAFTNLSRDHLDYHKDMEDYFNAKKKLFLNYLAKDGKAVISLETSYGNKLVEELRKKGKKNIILANAPEGDVRVEILQRKGGLVLRIFYRQEERVIKTEIFGDYQAKNIGTLLGILLAMDQDVDFITEAIARLRNPPGRLEVVAEIKGAKVVVDYAHTPSALEEALKSLREVKEKKLLVLFGCGGNRDRGKRPIMGKIASTLADQVILTSDNPRFENPLSIIEDIKTGINGKTPLKVIPERKKALEETIKELNEGDILLVAGKGHEEYQEIMGRKIPFSDREEVLKIVKNLEGKK